MRKCGLNGYYRLLTRKSQGEQLTKFLAIHSFIYSFNKYFCWFENSLLSFVVAISSHQQKITEHVP